MLPVRWIPAICGFAHGKYLWLEHSAQWLEHVNDHHMTAVGTRELELHFISDTNNNVLG